jgi:hypothetical protein
MELTVASLVRMRIKDNAEAWSERWMSDFVNKGEESLLVKVKR